MDNIVDFITSEVDAVKQQPVQPIGVGMYRVRNVNAVMAEAKKRPDPEQLFDCFWYEGEISCLFADSNLGKSILAVEIGNNIASKGKPVLYFDFELADKQFQLRYTTPDGQLYPLHDNLLRADINREALDCDFDAAVIPDLEQTIVANGCRVVIVDNLTWLCGAAEKGEDAAALMQRLMQLKFKHELSMLVIAHTPKRDMYRPITPNDLAGSRKLFNFFDSVFAIGRSARDEGLRYIKQIKCRYGNFTYDAENVIVCSIEKDARGFLHFERQGTAKESAHLKELSDHDETWLRTECQRLKDDGKSFRAIASELGLSLGKVQRILRKL